MYVIDVRHYLNDKGDIVALIGPARKMTEFVTAVIAHASDFDRPEEHPGPLCFKCRKRDRQSVHTMLDEDDIVRWHCVRCNTSGQISNWQHTFWDLSQGLPLD
jgi:hypothetical protein